MSLRVRRAFARARRRAQRTKSGFSRWATTHIERACFCAFLAGSTLILIINAPEIAKMVEVLTSDDLPYGRFLTYGYGCMGILIGLSTLGYFILLFLSRRRSMAAVMLAFGLGQFVAAEIGMIAKWSVHRTTVDRLIAQTPPVIDAIETHRERTGSVPRTWYDLDASELEAVPRHWIAQRVQILSPASGDDWEPWVSRRAPWILKFAHSPQPSVLRRYDCLPDRLAPDVPRRVEVGGGWWYYDEYGR